MANIQNATYPENIIREIFTDEIADEIINDFNHDRQSGLDFVLNNYLTDKRRTVIKLRYEDGVPITKCAEPLGITRARAGQLHNDAIKILQHPIAAGFIKHGFITHARNILPILYKYRQDILCRQTGLYARDKTSRTLNNWISPIESALCPNQLTDTYQTRVYNALIGRYDKNQYTQPTPDQIAGINAILARKLSEQEQTFMFLVFGKYAGINDYIANTYADQTRTRSQLIPIFKKLRKPPYCFIYIDGYNQYMLKTLPLHVSGTYGFDERNYWHASQCDETNPYTQIHQPENAEPEPEPCVIYQPVEIEFGIREKLEALNWTDNEIDTYYYSILSSKLTGHSKLIKKLLSNKMPTLYDVCKTNMAVIRATIGKSNKTLSELKQALHDTLCWMYQPVENMRLSDFVTRQIHNTNKQTIADVIKKPNGNIPEMTFEMGIIREIRIAIDFLAPDATMPDNIYYNSRRIRRMHRENNIKRGTDSLIGDMPGHTNTDNSIPVSKLNLPDVIKDSLSKADIKTVGDIKHLTFHDLTLLHRIGSTTAAQIIKTIKEPVSIQTESTACSEPKQSKRPNRQSKTPSKSITQAVRTQTAATMHQIKIQDLGFSNAALEVMNINDIITLADIASMTKVQLAALSHMTPTVLQEIKTKYAIAIAEYRKTSMRITTSQPTLTPNINALSDSQSSNRLTTVTLSDMTGLKCGETRSKTEQPAAQHPAPKNPCDINLRELKLRTVTAKTLQKNGIKTLADIWSKSEDELLAIPEMTKPKLLDVRTKTDKAMLIHRGLVQA